MKKVTSASPKNFVLAYKNRDGSLTPFIIEGNAEILFHAAVTALNKTVGPLNISNEKYIKTK